ncbi:MAG: O-antigen ligase family protein [Anaerolineae bacterium]|nr:O-antigen ligase family protein [Anaerolineae bacterium]MDW8097868.1 O-antigen ligase family protein [Anaerolineae bacterium]
MVGWRRWQADLWPRLSYRAMAAGALVLLSAVLARAPLRWAALLVAGSAAGLAILAFPWLGLLLLAFAIPFGPLLPLPIGSAAADVTELLVLLVITAWLAREVAQRAVMIPHPPLWLPALLLLGAYLVSLPEAWSLQEGLIEMAKWIEGLVVYLAVAALLPQARVPWLLGALLLGGALEALLGIYQFTRAIGPEPFQVLGRFIRAYGTFRQPNPFGGYMGLTAPVALSLAWWAIGKAWQARLAPSRWRWLALMAGLLAAAGLISLGLIASWSRGAWLGFIAAVIAIIVIRGRRVIAVVSLIALVVLAVGLVSGYAGDQVTAALAGRLIVPEGYVAFIDPRTIEITDANFAAVQRLAQWWAAWGMFNDHPWLGVGVGNYAVAYPVYALPRWYEPLGHAHNYYLNVAAEAGIIGLLAYVFAGLAAFIWVGRQALCLREWPRALAIGVFGVLVHLGVHSLFDNLYVQHMLLHIALLTGALAVQCHKRGLSR